MGEVYRARDARLHREVAIKVLQDPVPDRIGWERFQREARSASALSHPHICAVYDIGETEGRPYLVMELLEGRTLRARLSEQPIVIDAAVAVAMQIAEALDAAHGKGVIHRDIKPANIHVSASGHVKVLDFGVAKQVAAPEADETRAEVALTLAGTMVGTPQYMAPEVWRGRPADVRSDIWSLGVVLYEMLAGRVPFTAPTAVEVGAAILNAPLPPLPQAVPASLAAIVERCLTRSPDDRYQRAADVREALSRWRPASAVAKAPADRRSFSGGWWAGLVGVVALLAVVMLFMRRDRPATEAPRTPTGGRPSKNAEANDAFALAMQFQRVQNDIDRSRAQLERALTLDPQFAEARRHLASNSIVRILNGYTNDTSVLYKAEEELRRAQRDDPALATLPSAFAAVYLMQGRKDMIPAAALDRALVQESVATDARLWRAIIAWLDGDNVLVKDLVRQSLEREPLFAPPRMFLGETLRTEGDLDGAIREERRVLEQAPNNISAIYWLALAYLDADRLADARALLEEKRAMFADNYLWRAAWALLLAREGRRDEAIAAMDAETLKFGRAAFVATLSIAEFYALVGDQSAGIEWVEIAVRNGDERLEWFRRDPQLASIRQDPRFQRILQSIESRRQGRR